MANRTVKDAQTIKGTNPQYLVEKIIRTRIYDSQYWKEDCFALTAELVVDKAMQLRYIGGVYAGNIKPAPFLCLVLKMLQIQPEKDIVIEFIKNEDFKYVRALGAFYLRLIGTSMDCYKYLEPLLNDYRKVRVQGRDGKFAMSHMDEFIDELLTQDRHCDVILPRIQKRHVLEESNDLEPRVSLLEADDLDDEEEEDDEEDEDEEGMEEGEHRGSSRGDTLDYHSRERRRSRSRDRSDRHRGERRRSRDRQRSRSRSRDRKRRRRSRSDSPRSSRRDKDRSGGRERRSDKSGGGGGGGGKDELSVEETNKLRASLGLPPLK